MQFVCEEKPVRITNMAVLAVILFYAIWTLTTGNCLYLISLIFMTAFDIDKKFSFEYLKYNLGGKTWMHFAYRLY